MGSYRLIPMNDVALGAVPEEGILLWHGLAYQLGRATTKLEGFPLPQNLSQISSRHCSLRPSVQVRAWRDEKGRVAKRAPHSRSSVLCARGRQLSRPRAGGVSSPKIARCITSTTNDSATHHKTGRPSAVDALRHEHQRHLHQRESRDDERVLRWRCGDAMRYFCACCEAGQRTTQRSPSITSQTMSTKHKQGEKVGKGKSRELNAGDVVSLSIVSTTGAAAQQPQGIQ